MNKKQWTFVYTSFALLLFSTSGQHTAASLAVVDEINTSFIPSANFHWNAAEVGWLYTADFSYDLAGIATRFAGTDGRTVTLEVFHGIPVEGGTLLRTTDYVPVTQEFTQAVITPVPIVAGEDYFIGYRNTANLKVNVAIEMEAENLPVYFSFTNTGIYGIGPKGDVFTGQPILQFLGVPEPTGACGFLASAAALATLSRRRFPRRR